MPGEAAFERALEALSRKELTSGELVAWLGGRGFAAGEIEDAVERLIAAGMLDDERFAADKRELAGWGPERIRLALGERGLDRSQIEAVLATDGRSTQLERAIELLDRRGERPVDEPSRGRALAYLARRGYDAELAYDAVRDFEARAA